MELTGDLLRGHTDMILLAILNRGDSYGYAINKQIEEASEGTFILTEATLYTTFKRLETKGYISSYWQRSESGKKRKYYSITAAGSSMLEKQRQAWRHAKEVIDTMM